MMRIVGLLLLIVAVVALAARFLPTANRWLLAAAALAPYLMLGAPLSVLLFALSRHWTLVSIAAVLKAEPPRAFLEEAEVRVGAILDVTDSKRRVDLLTGLDEDDRDFAEKVRQAIFTFNDIPDRVEPKLVPGLMRMVDREQLVTVIAAVDEATQRTIDFILGAMSQRMAGTLRTEASDIVSVDENVAETARRGVTESVRTQLDALRG